MSGFTKLFGSIVASSIWCEDDKTRIVWVTMLAMANRDGVVEAAVPGLAHAARVSVEDCRKALDKFESPDPDSRSTEHEGRRIAKVEGGWQLLNYVTYRKKLSADERREYKALKQRQYRERDRQPEQPTELAKMVGEFGEPGPQTNGSIILEEAQRMEAIQEEARAKFNPDYKGGSKTKPLPAGVSLRDVIQAKVEKDAAKDQRALSKRIDELNNTPSSKPLKQRV